jgi:hypothetical protein
MDLMKVHASTLFAMDAEGRLLYVREPGAPHAPPRFFLGRTLEGNIWHVRRNLPEGLDRDLELRCRTEPIARDFTHPPRAATKVRSVLETHAPIRGEERGPAFRIPANVSGLVETVRITMGNGHVLRAGFPWLFRRMQEGVDVGPVVAVVVDGSAVSACYCARFSPSAAEAGVVTSEAMRRKGYAAAAVSAWAAAVEERGLLPLYSTTWENSASLRVADKLRMEMYGEDWSIE